MNINQQQIRFLEKRRKLIQAWRVVGPMLLLVIVIFVIFQFQKTPLLINPFEVITGLESGSIKQSTIEIMAVILPVMFIAVSLLLVIIVIMMFTVISNEKKYIEIIERLINAKSGKSGPGNETESRNQTT
jgi:hypothetical protein